MFDYVLLPSVSLEGKFQTPHGMSSWGPGGHPWRRWNAWRGKDVTRIAAGDPLRATNALFGDPGMSKCTRAWQGKKIAGTKPVI